MRRLTDEELEPHLVNFTEIAILLVQAGVMEVSFDTDTGAQVKVDIKVLMPEPVNGIVKT